MKNNKLINKKSIKTFRSYLRNRFSFTEAALWNILKSRNLDIAPYGKYNVNHPGRDQLLQYIDYHIAPATPPSKGGDNIIALNFTIIIGLPFLILHLIHFQTPKVNGYTHGTGINEEPEKSRSRTRSIQTGFHA